MQTKKLFELILSIILCIVSPMTFCQNENSIDNTIINNNIVGLPLYWPELEFTDDDREPDGTISEETYSRKMTEWWNGSIDHDYLAFYSPDENKQELSVRGLKAEDFLTNENYFVFIEIKNVIIPDEINGFPVVSIDEEAFCNGESGDNIDKVERIVIGKSITEIKDVALVADRSLL